MTRRAGLAIVALAAALAVWWYLRRTRAHPAPPTAPAAAAVDGGAPTAPPTAAPTAPSADRAAAPPRFRTIDPAARRALLDRMAAARAARAAGHPVAAPSSADAPLPGTISADDLFAAIQPLIPSFRDCYDQTRAHRTVTSVNVKFDIHLSGDPDLGTLIESVDLDGDDAFKADPELATCLHETMSAVELPPMVGGSDAEFKATLQLADDEPPPDDAGP